VKSGEIGKFLPLNKNQCGFKAAVGHEKAIFELW